MEKRIDKTIRGHLQSTDDIVIFFANMLSLPIIALRYFEEHH